MWIGVTPLKSQMSAWSPTKETNAYMELVHVLTKKHKEIKLLKDYYHTDALILPSEQLLKAYMWPLLTYCSSSFL